MKEHVPENVYKTESSREGMACWNTEEKNMNSNVSPTKRRFAS